MTKAKTRGDDMSDPTANEKIKIKVETVAEAYLELLALRGFEYFFGNPGTDFASIIDAFAHREKEGKLFPRPIAVPHEIVLMGMAHGYYQATGKPQVVMVHVGVGAANAVGGLLAASRERIPVLFTAGRTPITEEGSPGSRSRYIHWGQEYFDQAGMIREHLKWDYELRTPAQLESVVDRALTAAMSEPRGPVYLMLPREVLCTPLEEIEVLPRFRYDLPTFYPDPIKIQKAADLLVKAEFPLIVTSSVGRNPEAVAGLRDLAEAGAIGIVSFNPEYMNFPTRHPCYLGFEAAPYLQETDLILALDCDVPWYPNTAKPKNSAIVIQAGIDPLFLRYPIRSFPSDLTLHGDPALVLSALREAVARHPARNDDAMRTRATRLGEVHTKLLLGWRKNAVGCAADTPLDYEWVSYKVNEILRDDVIVVNELGIRPTQLERTQPGTYYGHPHAGFLGWSLGAALGIQLASPGKTVVATVGDGAYMFSVPSACHAVAAAYQLPLLIIVYNNRSWNQVKLATRSVHPQGWAVRTNRFPMSSMPVSGQYEKFCEAFGGYGETVQAPEQLGPALDRALHAVTKEKRQALLNVICK
ncbi:MAG: thiamine pyrophosphate-requiring protein [Thermodesulfobacteriota bacterium]